MPEKKSSRREAMLSEDRSLKPTQYPPQSGEVILPTNSYQSLIEQLEDELINLYDYIQPRGILLVLEEADFKIIKVSDNTNSFLGIAPEHMLGRTLDDFLSESQISRFRQIVYNNFFDSLNLLKIKFSKPDDDCLFLDGIVHRAGGPFLILELEPSVLQNNNFLDFYHFVKASADKLQHLPTLTEMCQSLVQEIRNTAGFDRVMLYKFNSEGHGSVIAEDKKEDLESFLGLHFPCADTKPCHNLMISNWVRLIVDAEAKPAQIISLDRDNDRPIDLSLSVLRGISPCHVEYLKNMRVRASLSISIIKQQELWGFISCHHYAPRYISYEVREACKFLGQVMSKEIALKENNEHSQAKIRAKNIQYQLLERMSREKDFLASLLENEPSILDLVNAQGAVIWWDDNCTSVGKIPPFTEINLLVEWLAQEIKQPVFQTDRLSSIYPAAEQFKDIASGLLSISIGNDNHILWFRPELVTTVTWAGNPNHATVVEQDEQGNSRLSPRGSFQAWQEIVKSRALPWQDYEIEAASELRSSIVNIFIYQANEIARLAKELERSNAELEKFAYIASHDLQEPLNLVSSYVQLLAMRYEEQLDRDAKDYINFAVEGVQHMQTWIDDLLAYSRVGSRTKEFQPLELKTLFDRVVTNLQSQIEAVGAAITCDALPTIVGDATQLSQLLQNLIGNALKFKGERSPQIHLGIQKQKHDWLFCLEDNGIGIDSQFFDRIFVIFQRLHPRDEYSGNGIGLVICKKIIQRHGGRIWVESELGKGSKFFWTIPDRELLCPL
jgi:chemotaxis family two-component system sensor kinase Cph1